MGDLITTSEDDGHEPHQRTRPLTRDDVDHLLVACGKTRYARRNRVVVLLTFDAGLKVGEISRLRRADIMEDGNYVPRLIVRRGSVERVVPMSDRLFRACLEMLRAIPGDQSTPLLLSERADAAGSAMRPDSLAFMLYRVSHRAGLSDVSSHSGRRAFLQRAIVAARNVTGASLRDVQKLGGFSRLANMQIYESSEGDVNAQRRLVNAISEEAQRQSGANQAD